MGGGGLENGTTSSPSAEPSLITNQLSVLSINDDEHSSVSVEKDPRKIARNCDRFSLISEAYLGVCLARLMRLYSVGRWLELGLQTEKDGG
ncbi:hypothetical protein MTR67_029685 [Solanum verrucosum]|uniref:Uncharacterized protein n=1 Tax=Solanum verrucosum TaxID=315347 RepID=A0AAF0RBK3_SOLVR|nr:hypothetical protein MTR67_029685 [Solanum verrucosum]